MHPEHIKASIRLTGTSAAQIARDLRVSKTTVRMVIHGRTKSTRIARRICEIAGLNPEECWPGRYPEFEHFPIRYAHSAEEATA